MARLNFQFASHFRRPRGLRMKHEAAALKGGGSSPTGMIEMVVAITAVVGLLLVWSPLRNWARYLWAIWIGDVRPYEENLRLGLCLHACPLCDSVLFDPHGDGKSQFFCCRCGNYEWRFQRRHYRIRVFQTVFHADDRTPRDQDEMAMWFDVHFLCVQTRAMSLPLYDHFLDGA